MADIVERVDQEAARAKAGGLDPIVAEFDALAIAAIAEVRRRSDACWDGYEGATDHSRLALRSSGSASTATR